MMKLSVLLLWHCCSLRTHLLALLVAVVVAVSLSMLAVDVADASAQSLADRIFN